MGIEIHFDMGRDSVVSAPAIGLATSGIDGWA
jgi:hypothetical protein